MKKLTAVFVCIWASACAAKNDASPADPAGSVSGASSSAAVHLALRTFDSEGKAQSSIVQADRRLTLNSAQPNSSDSQSYVTVRMLKDYDNETTPEYRLSLGVFGNSGVSGLPETRMKALNADMEFFLPDVTPGKTYECGDDRGDRNGCFRSFGVYSVAPEVKDAFGRVTSPADPLLFGPRGITVKCTVAIGADSETLILQNQGKSSSGRDYFDAGVIPYAPTPDYAPNALKKFAFAFRCVDGATGGDLLYATYTQNGAALPSL